MQLCDQPGRHWPLRCSAFIQQNQVGIVIRTINTTIPRFEELMLPPILRDIIMASAVWVIFVGATGSGKTTRWRRCSITATAIPRPHHHHRRSDRVRARASQLHRHPARDWHRHRQLGVALKNTLRQAPDVILIGEIRERETMDHAIAFAETGHLCLATLHANNTNQALDRIINFFPEERRQQLLMDLSLNLRSFVSQRLIARRDAKGRVPAVEILLNSPLISDLIFKVKRAKLKEIMKKSNELGMQTFDQSLFQLHEAGHISYEDALRNADSVNDLRLRIKLEGHEAQGRNMLAGLEHLDIVK